MINILNITDEPYQVHIITTLESEVILSLRHYDLFKFWTMDVSYKEKEVLGVKISLGALHIESENMPFDFVCIDHSNNGIDPFKDDDFISRCSLIMLEPDDMTSLRGATVE